MAVPIVVPAVVCFFLIFDFDFCATFFFFFFFFFGVVVFFEGVEGEFFDILFLLFRVLSGVVGSVGFGAEGVVGSSPD